MSPTEWFLAVILIIAAACLLGYYFYMFSKYPKEKQLTKVKEWLLYAVTEAEKTLGGGTGQIKLRYVYDMFLVKFPYVAKFISFDRFSKLVDEALDKFRVMLESNTAIKNYVDSNKEENTND